MQDYSINELIEKISADTIIIPKSVAFRKDVYEESKTLFGVVFTECVNDLRSYGSFIDGKTVGKMMKEYVMDMTIPDIQCECLCSPTMASAARSETVMLINESGLYSLILKSKLDTAKKFKRWVTSEVLPSIRKYGFYANDERLDDIENNSDTIKNVAKKMKEERRSRVESEYKYKKMLEEKDALIAELNPKADFCDDVLTGERLMNVTMIAKDYGMSAQEMNGILKSFGVQYKLRREQLWVITAKYQHLGLTKTVMYKINDEKYRQYTLWTEIGRKFIYDLLKENGILPKSERLIQTAMENYYDTNEGFSEDE